MLVAQLVIRCDESGRYVSSLLPPGPTAPALVSSYAVPVTRTDEDEVAALIERIASLGIQQGDSSIHEMLILLGQQLAGLFLPDAVRHGLAALAPECPLLIVTDVVTYPWELLFVDGDFLALQRPVGRQLLYETADSEQPAKLMPGGQRDQAPSLLLIANPTADLDASESEAQRILDVVDALPQHLRCTAIFREQARRSVVLAELTSGGYTLIHYTGHADAGESGANRQSLRLSDGALTAAQLRSALVGAPLVFLNACASARSGGEPEFVLALLQAGVRGCIGTFWPVSDSSSADTSATFYQSLLRGHRVGDALWQARRMARALHPHDYSWAAFTLYGDPTWQPVAQARHTLYLATIVTVQRVEAAEMGEETKGKQGSALTEWFEASAATIGGLGGRVWQLGPKGLLAAFGVADGYEDQAERAAQAALVLQAAANAVGVAVVIALETGSVMVQKTAAAIADELISGPAVEEAIQLSTRANSGQIVAGLAAYQLLGERCTWAADTAEGYLLVAMQGAEQSDFPTIPLVGRDEEMGSLFNYWQRCQSQRLRQVVGLVGEAGIGKTRLMRAFRQMVKDKSSLPPIHWIGASCPSYLNGEPFALLRALVRQGLKLAHDATPSEWQRALRQLVGSEAEGERADLAPITGTTTVNLTLLEQALGLAVPAAASHDIADAVRRAQLVALFKYLMQQMINSGPAILAIDDIQQIDEASLEVLSQLIDSLDHLPLLWLFLYRREWLPPWANKRRCHVIDLDELGSQEQEKLLALWLPDEASSAVRAAILDRAGGNPLYMEELARVVRNLPSTSPASSFTASLASPIPLALLPTSLRLTIQSRVAQLATAARVVLELAATAASPFHPAVLAAVLDKTGETSHLEEILAELVRKDFVRLQEPLYIFYHPLLEEVIYSGLFTPTRQSLHRRLADVLADQGVESPEVIAWHCWRSVTAPSAQDSWSISLPPFGPTYLLQVIRALMAAGEAAMYKYSHREAMRWYQATLDVVAYVQTADTSVTASGVMADRVIADGIAEAECHTGIGKALSRMGLFEAAIQHLQSAFEHFASLGEQRQAQEAAADLARRIGRLQLWQGQNGAALEWMERGRELLSGNEEASAQAALALITVHTGSVYHWQGELDQASRHYREGIRLAEGLHNPQSAALAEGCNGLGVVLMDQGESEEARHCFDRALATWQALGDAYEQTRVEENLGNLYFSSCDWPLAFRLYQQSLSFWEHIDERNHRAYSLINLGGVYTCQGQWQEAEHCYQAALRLWEAMGEVRMPALAHTNLGHLALERAELATARLHLYRALAILDEQGVDSFRAETLTNVAELYLQEKEFEEALLWGGRALEMAQRQSLRLEEGIAQRLLGRAHQGRGTVAQAHEHLLCSLHALEATSNRHEVGRTWVALAELQHEMEQTQEARLRLDQATALFERLGAQPDLIRVRALREELYGH